MIVPTLRRRSPYHSFMVFFLGLGALMFFGFSFSLAPTEETDPLTYMAVMNASRTAWGGVRGNTPWLSASPYTSCLMQWGAPGASLNLMDLTGLAQFAYVGNRSHYDKLLDISFGAMASRTYFDEEDVVPRMVATCFSSSKPGGRSTVVVSIKGTSTAKDVFTDASLYAVIAVLQILSHFMPLLDLVPNTFIASLLYRLRLPDIVGEEERLFEHARRVVRFVNTSEAGDAALVLTGHSLGGGIAAALGASLKIPTVVFSAPGGHFSRKRFGTTREQSYRNVLNIIPDTDIVPAVDRHDATTQHIVCQDREGMVRKPWECHYIANTICELYRACGDSHGRDFTRACASKINHRDLGAYVTNEEQAPEF